MLNTYILPNPTKPNTLQDMGRTGGAESIIMILCVSAVQNKMLRTNAQPLKYLIKPRKGAVQHEPVAGVDGVAVAGVGGLAAEIGQAGVERKVGVGVGFIPP